jgi:hypothetical protein
MCAGDRPMDRLVCGDVGFGKTEAAMRAAFRAVDNGRQAREHQRGRAKPAHAASARARKHARSSACMLAVLLARTLAWPLHTPLHTRPSQVAFLAPTTVLAAQHLLVLRRRMPLDVRIEARPPRSISRPPPAASLALPPGISYLSQRHLSPSGCDADAPHRSS